MSKLTTPLTTPGCIYLKENVSILQRFPWGGHSCETYETHEKPHNTYNLHMANNYVILVSIGGLDDYEIREN